LSVDVEKLRLVGELVKEGPDRWEAISGSVRKESVLPSNILVHFGTIPMTRTQYGNIEYLAAMAMRDASATLSHR